MTALPVFTKDHQTIGKQGVFFRAGVARRRAIFKTRGSQNLKDRRLDIYNIINKSKK
jgi:hypothetical protein